MLEAAVISVALWSALYALRVLPGDLAQITGASSMILVGIGAGVLRARRMLIAALLGTTVLVSVVVFTPVSNAISTWWVRDDAPLPPQLDGVVVLSAGLNPDTTISGEALDRLLMGVELTRAHPRSVLVTTSKKEQFPAGLVASEVDQTRLLRGLGLLGANHAWVRVDAGLTTRDEAVSSAAALQPRGVRRIAVVTSPMHTRRACETFAEVGFLVTCVAARLRGAGPLPLSAVPEDRLAVFGDWIYEIAASIKYRALGWLRSQRSGPR